MSIIGKLVFPPRCAACRTLLPYDGEGGEVVLCRDCRGEWELEKLASCQTCGRPMIDCHCMPDMVRNAGCAGMVRLSAYNPSNSKGAVNSIVNNLKRIRDKDYFNFFAGQLIPPLEKMLSEFELDLSETIITFCPRRRSAVRDHGFDQSEELARHIAARSGARFEVLLERRPFHIAREQKHLDAAGRYENSRRAVRLTDEGVKAAGQRVILIDDIVTTGATISAAADLLRSAGVQLVIAACLATAVKR